MRLSAVLETKRSVFDTDFRVDTTRYGLDRWHMRVTDLVTGEVAQTGGTRSDTRLQGLAARLLKEHLLTLRASGLHPSVGPQWPPVWLEWQARKRYFLSDDEVRWNEERKACSELPEPAKPGHLALYNKNNWTTWHVKAERAENRRGWILETSDPVPAYWKPVVKELD